MHDSHEYTGSNELEPGESFEIFMRSHTRPNPDDLSSETQRIAIYNGSLDFRFKEEPLDTDSFVFHVSGDRLAMEQGELPNGFAVIFYKEEKEIGELSYYKNDGSVRYLDWIDPSNPGEAVTHPLDQSSLTSLMDAYYDLSASDGLEFVEVDPDHPVYSLFFNV